VKGRNKERYQDICANKMLSKLFGGILRVGMLLTLLVKYGDVTELVVSRRCTLIILFICGLGYLSTSVSSSVDTNGIVRVINV
jgi:hypothetical protein